MQSSREFQAVSPVISLLGLVNFVSGIPKIPSLFKWYPGRHVHILLLKFGVEHRELRPQGLVTSLHSSLSEGLLGANKERT